MKNLLVIALALTLAGCGNPLTRLLPKLEKIELPEELMVPPKELKLINKPSAEEIKKLQEEQKAKEAAANVSPQ
jgi:hypothetical protein